MSLIPSLGQEKALQGVKMGIRIESRYALIMAACSFPFSREADRIESLQKGRGISAGRRLFVRQLKRHQTVQSDENHARTATSRRDITTLMP